MQWSLHDKLAIAHAVFACIAVLITMPIALLAARYLRYGRRWFEVHALFNTLTVALVVLVFGLGMGAVASQDQGTQFSGPNSDLHHKVGLAILLLVLAQALLGVAAHRFPSGHPARRLHVPLGIVVAAGMYWETWEGMHNEWAEMSTAMTVTPQAVQIVFWAVLLVPVVLYGAAVGQKTLERLVTPPVQYTGVRGDEKQKEAVA